MKRKFITFLRVLHTGTVNFIRSISLAIAAMVVMVVTLTIVLFSIVTNATFNHEVAQLTGQVDVSVYLQDKVTDAQVKQLMSRIRHDPNVQKVEYLDKKQALQEFFKQNSNNPSVQQATAASGTNPIPATIHVYPKDLNKVQEIENFLTKSENKALQTSDSPSYNGDHKKAIDNIAHATNILREFGVIAVAVFAAVSALIIFNTIQMAIFNRRDELTIMRLLGASTWYIRGPFVVESAIYGILSAVFSVLIINAAFAASSGALQASSLGLLDIGYANTYFDAHFLSLLTMQLLIGIVIGAASSVVATQRYLKFKTK